MYLNVMSSRQLEAITVVEICVIEADVTSRPCDLLVLKHADGFYGVDKQISERIGFQTSVPEGSHVFIHGAGIGARKVLYLGVGELEDFRYEKIREFASQALKLAARETGAIRKICSPVHGPGYGLDDKEAFLSLVSGFYDAIEHGNVPNDLGTIEIVEQSPTRTRRFQKLLSELQNQGHLTVRENSKAKLLIDVAAGEAVTTRKLSFFGSESERKRKLFVAMPFADQHSDVWDIAIQEACLKTGLVCERVREQAYVGDILREIRKRLSSCSGLIVLLNGANPNVFLELGYAWALEKPTVLMMSINEKPPFDVQGQRILLYKSIADLRQQLTHELDELSKQGVFGFDTL